MGYSGDTRSFRLWLMYSRQKALFVENYNPNPRRLGGSPCCTQVFPRFLAEAGGSPFIRCGLVFEA